MRADKWTDTKSISTLNDKYIHLSTLMYVYIYTCILYCILLEALHKQRGRDMDRQTDIQTYRQTDRQTGRQTEKETHLVRIDPQIKNALSDMPTCIHSYRGYILVYCIY